MKIEYIKRQDKVIEDIIDLGDNNSKTLGHLPRDAYYQMADDSKVIAALDNNGDLMGHLIIRLPKRDNVAKILHLCIHPNFRGRGVADGLIAFLKSKVQSRCREIGLNCRNDYEYASKLWKRNGFYPVGEKRSRSIKENYLTYWRLPLNDNDLFSTIDENKIKVAIDSNVVIKLRQIKDEDSEEKEIQALMADHILSEVSYYVANEIYHEINRDSDRNRRARTRTQVNHFSMLPAADEYSKEIAESLEDVIVGSSVNDQSDRRQLAESIANNFQYFLTTDQGILDQKEKIQKKYGLSVMSPVEFLLEKDRILDFDSQFYQRFAGTAISLSKIYGDELEEIIDEFLKKDQAERKNHFKGKLSEIVASEDADFKLLTLNQQKVGLFGFIMIGDELNVNVLRAKGTKYYRALFEQLLQTCAKSAMGLGATRININEKILSSTDIETLTDMGFFQENGIWTKLLKKGIHTIDAINKTIPDILKLDKAILADGRIGITEKRKLEKTLFPLKFKDAEIPCYIIPIKPFWASQLFDYRISEKELFGSNINLSLSLNNVYYRSVTPNIEKEPGRVLWYVSDSRNYNRCRGINASSYLNHIVTGKPKDLFAAYKKMGIYSWKHVYNLAKQDISKDIKAIEFSHTEVFETPVSLDNIRQVLGKEHSFQGPIRITNSEYLEIYRLAHGNG